MDKEKIRKEIMSIKEEIDIILALDQRKNDPEEFFLMREFFYRCKIWEKEFPEDILFK